MTTLIEPVTRLMTAEEFEALPDDGVERWLIRGQLREGGVTVRNFDHSAYMMRIGQLLLTAFL